MPHSSRLPGAGAAAQILGAGDMCHILENSYECFPIRRACSPGYRRCKWHRRSHMQGLSERGRQRHHCGPERGAGRRGIQHWYRARPGIHAGGIDFRWQCSEIHCQHPPEPVATASAASATVAWALTWCNNTSSAAAGGESGCAITKDIGLLLNGWSNPATGLGRCGGVGVLPIAHAP